MSRCFSTVALLKGGDLQGAVFPWGGTSVWGAKPGRRRSRPRLCSHPAMQLKCHSEDIYKPQLVKKDNVARCYHLGNLGHSCILEEFLKELEMRYLLWFKSRSFVWNRKHNSVVLQLCSGSFLPPSAPVASLAGRVVWLCSPCQVHFAVVPLSWMLLLLLLWPGFLLTSLS